LIIHKWRHILKDTTGVTFRRNFDPCSSCWLITRVARNQGKTPNFCDVICRRPRNKIFSGNFINYLTNPTGSINPTKTVFVQLFIAFLNATIKFRPLFVCFSSGQILFQFDNISSYSSEPRIRKNVFITIWAVYCLLVCCCFKTLPCGLIMMNIIFV
jgi:hypothetical protein